jgi:hypothetical protein
MTAEHRRSEDAKDIASEADHWLETVRQQVHSLRYGIVQIVVHDSRVTQIDRTERLRLNPPPNLSFAKSPSDPPDHWRES